MNYPSYEASQLRTVGVKLADISQWVDEDPKNRIRTPVENLMSRTVVKLTEEHGELAAALIGMLGQNPRKGVTHTIHDVRKELFDIALTALCAAEHIDDNDGLSMNRFAGHVEAVRLRSLAAREASASARFKSLVEVNTETQPESVETFFDALKTEIDQVVKNSPETYHPDGTAR